MESMKAVCTLKTLMIAGMSQQQIKKEDAKWTGILKNDPFHFIPQTEKEKGIDLNTAVEANKRCGGEGRDYLISAIREFRKEVGAEGLPEYEGEVVQCGYGWGYDSKYLHAVKEARLRSTCIDVSRFACENAIEDYSRQWQELQVGNDASFPIPKIIHGEIRTILTNPDSVEMDLSKVQIWYFCRTLGCLSSRKSAKIVLERLGHWSLSRKSDPAKRKRIVFVTAFADDNIGYKGKRSILYSRDMILETLGLGAGREIEFCNEKPFRYFEQNYCAVTVRSKE